MHKTCRQIIRLHPLRTLLAQVTVHSPQCVQSSSAVHIISQKCCSCLPLGSHSSTSASQKAEPPLIFSSLWNVLKHSQAFLWVDTLNPIPHALVISGCAAPSAISLSVCLTACECVTQIWPHTLILLNSLLFTLIPSSSPPLVSNYYYY